MVLYSTLNNRKFSYTPLSFVLTVPMFTLPCFSDRSQQCDEARTVEPGGGCVVVPAGPGCGCGEWDVNSEVMCTPIHTICVVMPRATSQLCQFPGLNPGKVQQWRPKACTALHLTAVLSG